MARAITSRTEWNAIRPGSRVLVQYTGQDGDGPGEVVFVRFAETVRYPYGPTRVSGGDNWDPLWDVVESAALLSHAEAKERSDAEEAARLQRAIARYREVSRQKDEEFALLAKPFGGLRLAFRRFWS